MAYNTDTKARFLEILADMPFVIHASKKVGISRSTIYRWIKDDVDFRKAVEKAQSSGRENIVEMCELALVKKVREGDVGSAKFMLMNNSERYAPKRPLLPPPSIPREERDLLIEAYKLLRSTQRLSKEAEESIKNGLLKSGLFNADGRTTSKFEEHYIELYHQVQKEQKEKNTIRWQ